MTTIGDDEIKALETLATEERDAIASDVQTIAGTWHVGEVVAEYAYLHYGHRTQERVRDWMAATKPEVVLRLLARLREAERERDALRALERVVRQPLAGTGIESSALFTDLREAVARLDAARTGGGK